MKIHFEEIPDTGLNLEVSDSAWFPEGDWIRVGPLRVELFLSRQEQRVILDGRLMFTSRFACDCCLESYDDVQDSRFRIDFEYLANNDPYWLTEDHQCPESEMDVVVLREPEIDIDATLAQQVLLLLPVKRLCSESCKGLCPSCGQNLNKGTCTCHDQERESPFQVLAKLKLK